MWLLAFGKQKTCCSEIAGGNLGTRSEIARCNLGIELDLLNRTVGSLPRVVISDTCVHAGDCEYTVWQDFLGSVHRV